MPNPCPDKDHSVTNESYQPADMERQSISNDLDLPWSYLENQCHINRSLSYQSSQTSRSYTWKANNFVCVFSQESTNGEVEIGTIEHFVTLIVSNKEYVYILLSILPFRKTQDDLYYVNLKSSSCKKCANLNLISKPLVLGHDDTNNDIIWILNAGSVLRQRINS